MSFDRTAYNRAYWHRRKKTAVYTYARNEHKRELRFRFRERVRMSPEAQQYLQGLSIQHRVQLESPLFVVMLNGRRTREFLNEKLPQW